MDILATIRSSLNGLRKSERKVAEYVLKNPDEVMRGSITDLADSSGTSEPTVIRFCRRLGLSGYMDLRLNLASSLPTDPFILENVSEEDQVADIFNKLLNAAKEAIHDTLNKLDLHVLEGAVEALVQSRRIEFYGVGGSGIVATDAHHKFFRLGTPCVAYTDPHMQAMSAALLNNQDVVVAISHSGSTKDTIASVEIAKSKGAQIIGIMGTQKSPLAKLCDFPLSFSSQEVALRLAPMTSRLVQLAIVDVLFVSVAMKHFENIKGRLESAKKALVDKRY